MRVYVKIKQAIADHLQLAANLFILIVGAVAFFIPSTSTRSTSTEPVSSTSTISPTFSFPTSAPTDLPKSYVFAGGATFNYPDGWRLSDADEPLRVFSDATRVYVLDEVALDDIGVKASANEADVLQIYFEKYHGELAFKPAKVERLEIKGRSAAQYDYSVDDEQARIIALRFGNGALGLIEAVSLTGKLKEEAIVLAIAESFDSGSEASTSTSPASTSTEPPECTVSTRLARTVRVRVGPGTNRTSITFLPVDEEFQVLGKARASDGSLWWKLDKEAVAPDKFPNEVWVAQEDVKASGNCDAVKNLEAPPIIPIGTPAYNSSYSSPESGTYYGSIVDGITLCADGTIFDYQPAARQITFSIQSRGSSFIDVDGYGSLERIGNTFFGTITYINASDNRPFSRTFVLHVISPTQMVGTFMDTVEFDGRQCNSTGHVMIEKFPISLGTPTPTNPSVSVATTAPALALTDAATFTSTPTLTSTLNTPSPTRTLTATGTPTTTATPTLEIMQPTVTTLWDTLTQTAQAVGNTTQTALAVIVSMTPSQTPDPTVTPTLTPTYIEVASVPFRILSVSGIEIGNGTVHVFAPESIESSQSTTVELELNLDYRYITPTPAGPITPFPVTRVTSVPQPGKPTPTPRIPIYEERGITAYQRMGATLHCPRDRFTGCDTDHDPADAKLVDWENGVKWLWIIAPIKEATGLQDLQLEMWTIKRVNDDPEQADVIWDHTFTIEVKTPAETVSLIKLIQDNTPIVIGGLFTIGAALIGAGYIWRRKKSSESKVFISYRRKVGWSTARSIKDGLSAKGADVFLDVDDINEGRFEDVIKKAIAEREHFVLVLAPTTLESEWVVKETLHAIRHNAKIIPVLVDGFKLDDSTLPDELRSIKSHNAVTLTPEFFEAGINKLANFVGLETEKGR